MSVLSVDLGTSNTVAVLSAHGRHPRVVEVEGSAAMPSAVFAAEDGRLVVGREAERRARLDPARFEPNPKRRVDEGTLLLGDRVVPVTEAFAAVLAKVAGEVSRQLGGGRADEVRLTHPAQWGPVRRNVLLSAARQAGLGQNLVLVPEPVAAAAHFASFPGRSLAPGQALAVYDLGAGTFDVAVVAAGYTVLAEAGLPDLGGLDVDQALLTHVGRQVSARDPHAWHRLMMPTSTADRRARRALQDDVRAAKEALSAHPQTDLPLPEPFHDALVTRAELEASIRPNLLRSVELLSATVRSAGLTQDRLAGRLSGGWVEPDSAGGDVDRRATADRAHEPGPAGDGGRARGAPRGAGGGEPAHRGPAARGADGHARAPSGHAPRCSVRSAAAVRRPAECSDSAARRGRSARCGWCPWSSWLSSRAWWASCWRPGRTRRRGRRSRSPWRYRMRSTATR